MCRGIAGGVMAKRGHIQRSEDFAIGLVPTDIEANTDGALRVPFGELPAIGMGLSSIAEAIAPTVAEVEAPVLFTVTDAAGNPIAPSLLQKFNDGTGLLGSYRSPTSGFGQARLHVAETATQPPVAVLDPATLSMAAALMVVTQKLDAIQQAQEEMLEYLHQRDKAALRGALQTLGDIARDYRFNWRNDTFLQSSHAQVIEIRKQADSATTLQRAQIRGKLRRAPLEIRRAVGARLSKLLDHLAEYRLAGYVYALASFLEPLLSGNTDADYLHSVSARISARSVSYRELYSECYDAIEVSTQKSIDATFLGGLSDAGKTLGNTLAQTPLGDLTPVDEVLTDAGEGLGKLNDDITDSLMARLRTMSSPKVLSLQQGVESLASLRETSTIIAADSEALYLIPCER